MRTFLLKNQYDYIIIGRMHKVGALSLLHVLAFRLITVAAVLILGSTGTYAEDVDCSMCHPDLAKKKTVHAAVSMGCTGCHTSLNVAEVPHKVTGKFPKGLSAEQPDLCYGCHDKGIFTKKNVHAALAMGCTSCHNPHSSDNQKLLLADAPDLCYTCHDKTGFNNTSTHSPVAGGMCGSCHEVHSAKLQKLLIARPPDLCFTCHDKNKFTGMKTVHGPVEKGLCTACHTPHASSAPKLLLDKTPDVCFRCHSRRHFEGQKFMHAPVAGGMCTACHAPHQSDTNMLLAKKLPDLCYTCHFEQEFVTRISHPPVQAGMCMICHEPHGADRERLLISSINTGCLTCHPRIAAKPHASGIGAKGHPLESKRKVSVDGKKEPLSCAGCHDPHGSTWNKLFRARANSFFELCKNCHEK